MNRQRTIAAAEWAHCQCQVAFFYFLIQTKLRKQKILAIREINASKGFGTLSIPMCPQQRHILSVWDYCPHSYTTLLHKPFLHWTLYMWSRAFQMSQILHTNQWSQINRAIFEVQNVYHSHSVKIIFTWKDLYLHKVLI